MNIGERLRQLREEKGLNRYQLCKQAKVNLAAVYKIEEGVTPNPSFRVIHRLSRVLGATMESWNDLD